ncbi:MAG TPA: SGNH/GDSL hydrolase family protein [Alloacidobacterium sp.]|nr:SGNH/GDSL hydrolase family protein [Alloacidobacterium sp.]
MTTSVHIKSSFTFLLIFLLSARAQTPVSANSSPALASTTWVGSWAASQQIPEPNNAVPPESLHNATLRQIVHLSLGGSAIRVHVSNAFGTTPLHLTAVHVARPVSPASSRIDPASDQALTFNERADIVIPMGAEYLSDPLSYPIAALSDLAITMQIEAAPEQETGHPGSRATSYLAAGVPASAVELTGAQTFDHWYFLSGVDVSAPASASAIVALGDSITDGHGATTNGNDRWTDDLAARLLRSPSTNKTAVLNEGIGGNRLLLDGLGPNALARLDRDVLAQNSVRYLIVLEGINDIGTLTRTAPASEEQHQDLVRRMIGAYQQIILRAHAHGIKVIGGTIMAFMGSGYYHPTASNENDRQTVNAWIRAAGHFDAVIDFDKIMGDPSHPDHLRPEYDCGDHLHPSPAGYHAMADAIPLALF